MTAIRRAIPRTDHRLISPQELAGLRERAAESELVRAALRALDPMRYQRMEVVRTRSGVEAAEARGWLRALDELAETIIAIRAAGQESSLP